MEKKIVSCEMRIMLWRINHEFVVADDVICMTKQIVYLYDFVFFSRTVQHKSE